MCTPNERGRKTAKKRRASPEYMCVPFRCLPSSSLSQFSRELRMVLNYHTRASVISTVTPRPSTSYPHSLCVSCRSLSRCATHPFIRPTTRASGSYFDRCPLLASSSSYCFNPRTSTSADAPPGATPESIAYSPEQTGRQDGEGHVSQPVRTV